MKVCINRKYNVNIVWYNRKDASKGLYLKKTVSISVL